MTQFVREDASYLIGIFRLCQQSTEQIDLAAGQRESIGNRRRQHRGLHRSIQPCGFAKDIYKFGKGLLAGGTAANLVAEYHFDLPIGDFPKTLLEGLGHQWRKTVSGERDTEQHHGDD